MAYTGIPYTKVGTAPTYTLSSRTGSAPSSSTSSQTQSALQSLTTQINKLFSEAPTPSASGTASAAASAASQAARESYSRAKAAIPAVSSAVSATGTQIDQYMKAAMFSALDKAAPGWRQTASSMNLSVPQLSAFAGNILGQVYPDVARNLGTMAGTASRQATAMLQGQVPGDVLEQVRRSSAEKAVAALGTGADAAGTSARNLLARDLGLTSLDVMKQGSAMAATASELYKQLNATGTSVGALLSAGGELGAAVTKANAGLVPQTTGTQWLGAINSLAGTLASAGAVSPNAAMQASLSATSQQAEIDWLKRVSMANTLSTFGQGSIAAGLSSNLYGGIS